MTGRTRKGSALLLMLGFMALIVTAAVCFSVSMRASRHAGAGLVSSERGRFLLAAALARAMSEVDADFGERLFADWPGRVRGADDLSATNGVVPVLTFEALAYLPAGLVEAVRERARCAGTARWQRLNYDAGRVAYIAVDVSDLLDANLTPVVTNRSFATHGRISLLPFFRDESEARQFDESLRLGRGDDRDVPYVSLLDLNVATGDAKRVLEGEALRKDRLFVVDSHGFPHDAPGSAVALTDGPEAWKALKGEMSETDWTVLCDYVDADSVPSSLDLPCAERVPQLGAVGWRSDGDGAVPEMTLAFPFRRCTGVDGAFRVVASVEVASGDGTFAASGDSSAEIEPERDFGPDRSTKTLAFPMPANVLPPAKDEDGQPTPQTPVAVKVSAAVVDDDGNVVDRMPSLAFSAVCRDGRLESVAPAGYAVADSRVNWKAEHWKASDAPAGDWFGADCEAGCAVSDAGYLQSLGELAFLPREDGAALDGAEFSLVDDRGEGPRADPYTSSTNVMMTALMATPRDWRAAATNAAPGNAGTLEGLMGATRGDMERIAALLMEAVRGAAGPDWRTAYDSLDWLADGDGADPFAGTSFAGRLNRADRRFLRDYWRGCLAKKQQLFLVFMRVEYGPRGVAVVARDPYPSPGDAPHRMRVLFYRQFDNRF